MRIGFAGRRAVVTGAGHGIGRAIAQQLAALGAQTLLFLASDHAGWITGQTLSVDGGK